MAPSVLTATSEKRTISLLTEHSPDRQRLRCAFVLQRAIRAPHDPIKAIELWHRREDSRRQGLHLGPILDVANQPQVSERHVLSEVRRVRRDDLLPGQRPDMAPQQTRRLWGQMRFRLFHNDYRPALPSIHFVVKIPGERSGQIHDSQALGSQSLLIERMQPFVHSDVEDSFHPAKLVKDIIRKKAQVGTVPPTPLQRIALNDRMHDVLGAWIALPQPSIEAFQHVLRRGFQADRYLQRLETLFPESRPQQNNSIHFSRYLDSRQSHGVRLFTASAPPTGSTVTRAMSSAERASCSVSPPVSTNTARPPTTGLSRSGRQSRTSDD